ncbi:hypothetical protein BHM03_00051407 [Ensete ventricosum]|nr:hypothetical protein BHM03_00051407 [Ensete ventricosum]
MALLATSGGGVAIPPYRRCFLNGDHRFLRPPVGSQCPNGVDPNFCRVSPTFPMLLQWQLLCIAQHAWRDLVRVPLNQLGVHLTLHVTEVLPFISCRPVLARWCSSNPGL